MTNFPGKFLDWVKAEILASGLLTSEEVFDQREKSIYWVIDKALTTGLGAACSIAIPTIRKADTATPDTLQDMTCQVSISCSALEENRNIFDAAVALYARFSSARFNPLADANPRSVPNVSANNFASSGDQQSGFLFTFDISTRIRIKP